MVWIRFFFTLSKELGLDTAFKRSSIPIIVKELVSFFTLKSFR
jgi:hypothetical protein